MLSSFLMNKNLKEGVPYALFLFSVSGGAAKDVSRVRRTHPETIKGVSKV